MDVFPDGSDVTIPSGLVSNGSLGWYDPIEVKLAAVSLDELKRAKFAGGAGVMEPPKRETCDCDCCRKLEDTATILRTTPPDKQETDVWRGILRPSLHGAT